MIGISPGKAALAAAPAAAAIWSAALLLYGIPAVPAAIGLAASILSSLAVWYTTDRSRAVGLQTTIHSSALLVATATAWTWAIGPLAADPLAWMALLPRLNAVGACLALSPLAALFCAWIWFDAARAARLRLRDRRRLSRSDLYGKARLLGPTHMRALARRRGILLGQRGAGRRAPLVAWSLEGAALTIAPPRTGKGATIALNYLSPDDRGFAGSTVLIDPRGETFCVVARRRRMMGRKVVLLDPFGVVAAHAENFAGDLHLPDVRSDSFNPLDFVRSDDAQAVRDIDVLLDAILTPPADERGNSRHFHDSARAIIGGYMAWVRFGDIDDAPRTLGTLHRILSSSPKERETVAARIRAAPRICGGLAHIAIEREAQVGKEEGGSNFTTIANQLRLMAYPEIAAQTAASTFDPLELAAGNTDLFVVVPEDMLDQVRGWIRAWITIPNAVAGRRPLARDLLLILDEMPRLGYLKPVLDGYYMAAGKGVHFWCFAQSLSALDDSWGKEKRRTLAENAEILQILGFPRTGTEIAEELSKAIGTATFESRSESSSGTVQDARLIANSQSQAGEQRSVVRERLVTPDDLMTLGPDEQYVIGSGKDLPRDALHLHHARYWTRPDARPLADPNPFVLRKKGATES